MPHNRIQKTTPTPVRFDLETKRRVRRVAQALGSNASAVVRLATIRLLQEIERTGELRVEAIKTR